MLAAIADGDQIRPSARRSSRGWHRRRRRHRRTRRSRRSAALTDQKQIATVAKSSPVDSVRAAAVERLTDVKSLSSVARHAADPRTAALASDRIEDPAELLNVATKTEHKDAGVSALERAVILVADRPRHARDGLADRAKSKAVAKRARAMVQAMDDAEAARKAALETHQQRIAGAIARVEALAASTDDGGRRAAAASTPKRTGRSITGRATHEIAAARSRPVQRRRGGRARRPRARSAGARRAGAA